MKTFISHIKQETAIYHPVVRAFIYLVLATILVASVALVAAVITNGAPDIKTLG